MLLDPEERSVPDDPRFITLSDAIVVVQGLSAWLKHVPEGAALQYKVGDTIVVFTTDAPRAGRILEILLETAGMA